MRAHLDGSPLSRLYDSGRGSIPWLIAFKLQHRELAPILWDDLKAALYDFKDGDDQVHFQIAVALGEMIDRSRFDEVVELLNDESLGVNRIAFFSELKKRVRSPRVREVIESFVDDPQLGREARIRMESYYKRDRERAGK